MATDRTDGKRPDPALAQRLRNRSNLDPADLMAAGFVPAESVAWVSCACGRPAAGAVHHADGTLEPVCAAVTAGHVEAAGPIVPLAPDTTVLCECDCNGCVRNDDWLYRGRWWVRPLRRGDADTSRGYLVCPACATAHERPGRPGRRILDNRACAHGPFRPLRGEPVVGDLFTAHGGQDSLTLTDWFDWGEDTPELLEWIRDPTTPARDSWGGVGNLRARCIGWYGPDTLAACECTCGCRRYGRLGELLHDDTLQCARCALAGHVAPHHRVLAREQRTRRRERMRG